MMRFGGFGFFGHWGVRCNSLLLDARASVSVVNLACYVNAVCLQEQACFHTMLVEMVHICLFL